MERNDLIVEDIRKVKVYVNQRMYNTVCAPPETKYRPRTVADAMFSLPYVIGVALLRGDVSLGDFTSEAIKDPTYLQAVNKVEIIIDRDVDVESEKLNLPLSLDIIEIQTKNGGLFMEKKYYAKGFPENPMTMVDCAEKAKKCASYAVKPFPKERIDAMKEQGENLEKLTEIQSLTKLLT
jgi:2-methylcitrate dehydratase PrpD